MGELVMAAGREREDRAFGRRQKAGARRESGGSEAEGGQSGGESQAGRDFRAGLGTSRKNRPVRTIILIDLQLDPTTYREEPR